MNLKVLRIGVLLFVTLSLIALSPPVFASVTSASLEGSSNVAYGKGSVTLWARCYLRSIELKGYKAMVKFTLYEDDGWKKDYITSWWEGPYAVGTVLQGYYPWTSFTVRPASYNDIWDNTVEFKVKIEEIRTSDGKVMSTTWTNVFVVTLR